MHPAAASSDAEKIEELRAAMRQRIDDGSITYPDDFCLWDYDAVRDYVYALESVEDLIDAGDDILDSRVLTPKQIREIEDLVTKRLVEREA